MTNVMITRMCRHRVYLLAFTLSAATCWFLITANTVFLPTSMHLRDSQNGTDDIRGNGSLTGTRGTVEAHRSGNSTLPGHGETSNRTRVVLLWSPMFVGFEFLQPGRKSFDDSACSERRCEITADRNRLVESDAIVFHLRTLSMMDLPRSRGVHQKWIFFSLEAPPYSRFHGMAFMHDMFNWTMTYRNDSDIVMRYGRVSRRGGHANLTVEDLHSLWKRKSKMAAWMVSHCITDSNREEYVREMKNYMDVVTFGECGVAVCPANRTNECLENFSKQFSFYLAFENAICDGYVTEKFYRTLNYDMIPVVFGGAEYSKIAPPGSYIDAMDFASPKKLASYLYKVSSNFSLFAEYFKWKMDGYVVRDVPDPCGLCEKLHSNSFQVNSVYDDMEKWWIARSNCRRWMRS